MVKLPPLSPNSPRTTALMVIQDAEDCKEPEPLEKVPGVMKKFLQDDWVQRRGCWCFAYKAVNEARMVLKCGGLEAIMQAMHNHTGSEKIQLEGCEALRHLSVEEEGCKRVFEVGALRSVLTAMMLHNECVRIQEEGLGAIKNMTVYHAAEVLDGGGLDAAIQTMRTFPQCSWVQMWGIVALGYFANLDAQRVSSLDGFQLVEFAMTKYKDLRVIQKQGELTARKNPKRMDEIRKKLLLAGSPEMKPRTYDE